MFAIDGTGHARVVIVGPAVPSRALSSPLRDLLEEPTTQPSPEEGWTTEQALNNARAVLDGDVGVS